MLAFLGRQAKGICQPFGATSPSYPKSKSSNQSKGGDTDGSIVHARQKDISESIAPPSKPESTKAPSNSPRKKRSLIWQALIWTLTVIFSFLCWRVLQHLAQHFPGAVRGELWVIPWLLWFWSWCLGGHKSTGSIDTQPAKAGVTDCSSGASTPSSGKYNAERVAAAEEAAFGSEDDVESYLKMLDERLRAQEPPSDKQKLLASGWQEHSKAGIEIYLAAQKRIKDEPCPRIGVYLKSKTQDQVASFPMVLTETGCKPPRLRGGGLVIYYCMKCWPLWFPFSQKTRLLKQISPFQQVWLHQIKVLWFTVDNIFLFALQDKLSTDGCIEVLMRTPPDGMDGKQWLGVTIPKTEAKFRVQIASMRLAGYPTSMDHCDFVFQAEIYDPLKGGINWITVMFWQTIAARCLPMILKMQAKFDGSVMDKYYNAGDDRHGKETGEAFIDLHDRIQKFVKGKHNSD
eukprot:gnl/MRDRNA2_/MRDRNA2_95018_c0_seq1.p1 gnl/MRDRNA2_/MRDRNA2_95018_c0~~gnl/MRDRNA2_/MRDRNA2_95018_c0_seq1.p1  ORF type:complete len:458 (-),score=86.21 gnl/MRDRNA2_/MRDRNA2_95018_c0_seq1:228-1601(-)